jgi:hypothetical protein
MIIGHHQFLHCNQMRQGILPSAHSARFTLTYLIAALLLVVIHYYRISRENEDTGDIAWIPATMKCSGWHLYVFNGETFVSCKKP